MIGLVVYISLPSEPKGVNIEPIEAEFNFYIVNDEIDQQDLNKYVLEADKIWNKYNISVLINKTYYVNINLSNEERNLLYTNISEINTKEENKRICDEEYMPIINQITNNNPNMSIIFVEGKGASGRGSLCENSFAIFKYEKNSWVDVTGWNLAHEMGHIFGLGDSSNIYKINLMNDKHKIFWKPSFLTQEQVDIIVKSIKDKQNNKNKEV
jgi:hypothetical protein